MTHKCTIRGTVEFEPNITCPKLNLQFQNGLFSRNEPILYPAHASFIMCMIFQYLLSSVFLPLLTCELFTPSESSSYSWRLAQAHTFQFPWHFYIARKGPIQVTKVNTIYCKDLQRKKGRQETHQLGHRDWEWHFWVIRQFQFWVSEKLPHYAPLWLNQCTRL